MFHCNPPSISVSQLNSPKFLRKISAHAQKINRPTTITLAASVRPFTSLGFLLKQPAEITKGSLIITSQSRGGHKTDGRHTGGSIHGQGHRSYIRRGQLKRDDTRAETTFRLSAKRTSPFKSAGGRQFSRLLAADVCA